MQWVHICSQQTPVIGVFVRVVPISHCENRGLCTRYNKKGGSKVIGNDGESSQLQGYEDSKCIHMGVRYLERKKGAGHERYSQNCTLQDWELQVWTHTQYRGVKLSLTSRVLTAPGLKGKCIRKDR